jgi:osmotically-inducible protein OsmY
MKTKLFLCGILLCAGLAFNSCKPSDAELQKAVTTTLSALPSSITSAVNKGEVTLTGVVESEEAKADAEKLVGAVKGIQSVVNNIEVQIPQPEPVINPDDVLRSAISTAVSAAGDAFKQVVVNVQNGEVNLTGSIKKADLTKLLQIVNEASPKKVNNALTIVK